MLDPDFRGDLDPDHGDYLAEMAEQGVPVRRGQPRQRTKAKSHSSACEHP